MKFPSGAKVIKDEKLYQKHQYEMFASIWIFEHFLLQFRIFKANFAAELFEDSTDNDNGGQTEPQIKIEPGTLDPTHPLPTLDLQGDENHQDVEEWLKIEPDDESGIEHVFQIAL